MPVPCTDGFPYRETVMSFREHSRPPAGPKPCRKNTGRLSADTVSFSRGPDISGACREKLPYLQYGLLFSSWHIDITSWWNVDSRNCRSTDMGIFRWPGMTPFLYPVAKVWQMLPKSALVTSDVIKCHQMSPDVRILTEKQVVILLFKSGCWNKIWSEKNSFCVNTAWQSEFMRILCSSEQRNRASCVSVRQKLFCLTETAPFREGRKHLLPSRNFGRKEVQIPKSDGWRRRMWQERTGSRRRWKNHYLPDSFRLRPKKWVHRI